MSAPVDTTADVVEFIPRLPALNKFRLEDFDDLQPAKQFWLVKGLWPRSGVCFVAGPSMSGKSFWLLDQLAKVVLGEPVLGRKSKAAGVAYIAAEGGEGVKNRITALRARTGPLNGAFKFIGQAPDLTDPGDVDDMRAILVEAKDAMAKRGIRLGVVALDTMSAAIPGADENTAKDMSPVLAALQSLAADLGLLIVVVAHTGKDSEKGLRGWSGLLANADGLIMLDSPVDDTRGGSVVKVKDGRSGDAFGFELVVVEIGTDDDGDPVTTCLVETCEPATKSSGSRRADRLSPQQELVLRAISQAIEVGPSQIVPPYPGVPAGTKGVLRKVAKDVAMRIGYADGDEKPESIRRKLNSHISDLIGKGRVRGEGDLLWLVD